MVVKRRGLDFQVRLLFIGLVLLSPRLKAGDIPPLLLRFDGYTGFLYDHRYPSHSVAGYSFLHGNPLDSAHHLHLPWLDADRASVLNANRLWGTPIRTPMVYASGSMGAEIGDGLLNQFTVGGLPNRDHSTDAVAVFQPTTMPLTLGARYRYFDAYSDRFDSLWGVRPMQYSEKGLVNDYTLVYGYQGERITASGSVSLYLGWGIAPIFFTPLYRTGYLINQAASLALPLSRLEMAAIIDYGSYYFDHQSSNVRIRPDLSMRFFQDVYNDVHAKFDLRSRMIQAPSTSVSASLVDTVLNPYSWKAEVGFLDDGQVFGGVKGSLSVLGPLVVASALEREVYPGERPFDFVTLTSKISYRNATSDSWKARLEASMHDSSYFPITGSVWVDVLQRFRSDFIFVDTATLDTTIYQAAMDQYLMTAGVRLHHSLDLDMVRVRSWITGHALLNRATEPLSIPFDAGMEFAIGEEWSEHNPFALLTFQLLGPMVLTQWFFDGETRVYRVGEQAFASVRLGIPFDLPFVNSWVKTRMIINAGPLRALGSKRMRMHPAGNEIGPMIAVKVEMSSGW